MLPFVYTACHGAKGVGIKVNKKYILTSILNDILSLLLGCLGQSLLNELVLSPSKIDKIADGPRRRHCVSCPLHACNRPAHLNYLGTDR